MASKERAPFKRAAVSRKQMQQLRIDAMGFAIPRREFLQLAAAAVAAAPRVLTAKKTGSPVILGHAEHRNHENWRKDSSI